MAEVTVLDNPRTHNFGDLEAVSATVTVVTTGDSWTCGLRAIEAIICPPQTGITNVDPDATNTKVVFTGTGTSIPVTAIGYA